MGEARQRAGRASRGGVHAGEGDEGGEVLTERDKALGDSFEDGEVEVELGEDGIGEWLARRRGMTDTELGSSNGDGGAGKHRAEAREEAGASANGGEERGERCCPPSGLGRSTTWPAWQPHARHAARAFCCGRPRRRAPARRAREEGGGARAGWTGFGRCARSEATARWRPCPLF